MFALFGREVVGLLERASGSLRRFAELSYVNGLMEDRLRWRSALGLCCIKCHKMQ